MFRQALHYALFQLQYMRVKLEVVLNGELHCNLKAKRWHKVESVFRCMTGLHNCDLVIRELYLTVRHLKLGNTQPLLILSDHNNS
jgi:hypothetical protein